MHRRSEITTAQIKTPSGTVRKNPQRAVHFLTAREGIADQLNKPVARELAPATGFYQEDR
ncbi:hypothetical protein EMIT0P228_120043 [Pseudomonas brassicacearum]